MAKHRVKCFEGYSYQEATMLYERWLHTIGSEPTVTVLSVRYDKDQPIDPNTHGRYYVLVRYKQEGKTEYTVTPRPFNSFMRLRKIESDHSDISKKENNPFRDLLKGTSV